MLFQDSKTWLLLPNHQLPEIYSHVATIESIQYITPFSRHVVAWGEWKPSRRRDLDRAFLRPYFEKTRGGVRGADSCDMNRSDSCGWDVLRVLTRQQEGQRVHVWANHDPC